MFLFCLFKTAFLHLQGDLITPAVAQCLHLHVSRLSCQGAAVIEKRWRGEFNCNFLKDGSASSLWRVWLNFIGM